MNPRPAPIMSLLSCLLMALSCGVFSAQVDAADDIRLTYTYGMEEVTITPPGGSRIKETWDESQRLELSLWGVNNGSAFGIGGVAHEATLSSGGDDLSFSSLGVRLYAGFSTPLSEMISLDAHGFFGYAWTDVELERGLTRWEDSSNLIEYGALAQVTLASGGAGGLLVALGGGYVFSDGSVDLAGKRDLDQQGVVVTGTLGWRF